MRTVPARLVGALAASLLLTGCVATPAASPTPTPVPTFLCTPEAGGAEYPCDQRAYDEMKATDALYAEAEAVLRRFLAEDARIQFLSDESTPSPVIVETTGGPFLQAMTSAYRQIREANVRGASDALPVIAQVRRQPGISRQGSVVALEACVDATRVPITRDGQEAGFGVAGRNTYFFVRDDSSLKIWTNEGQEVERC